jgi:superfamily II DNA or RNA helicase
MKDPLKSPLKILHEFIYPQYGSRMRISDIGDLFPSNKIIADTYSMGDDVAKEIQKQYELINIVSTDARNKELASNCKLTQMLRAWQRIEVLKIPTMLEMTKDSLESGLSVVIFVNFHDTMNILMEKLGTTCAIHGKQTAKERETNIDNFQSNKESLIICQIKSGGVGISLHDIHGGHPRISLISPSWSAQDLAQALGRIHRANGKTKCIQKIVYCADTVEEDICKAIQDKLDNYARINDGKDESKIKVRIEK